MPQLEFNFTTPDILLVMDNWVLTVLFALALVIFILISSILLYHWHHFAFDHQRIQVMKRIYFTGSFLFLGSTLVAIIFYGLSH